MASISLSSLPSMRRHHLFAEFAGLKQVCPDGVFVSLTPGDPTLWSGVIFVRKGPYATAILRFHISFPDTYPNLPPLVTFSTDIFHPLITPLTTYVHTTDITDNGTVSATDDERLPPGGFSLRHGFPSWFGRGSRSRVTSGQHVPSSPPALPPRPSIGSTGSAQTTPDSKSFKTALSVSSSPAASAFAQIQASKTAGGKGTQPPASTYDVLKYLASTFDSEEVLDSVPLEAAGNPGAWHAWQARQRKTTSTTTNVSSKIGTAEATSRKSEDAKALPRRPGEWNWEGVWEERVKRGIAASLSEAVLFGNSAAGGGGPDEVINFLNMDEADVQGVKDNLFRTLGVSPPAVEVGRGEETAS